MLQPAQPWAIFRALCRMKVRLLLQSLTTWRSRWSLALLALLAVGLCWSVSSAAVDFLGLVERLFPGQAFIDAVRWLLALGLVYLLGLVFTSDLIMGHTLNAGQLSTDHVYLSSLPVPPLALLGSKLFERLVTDWVGVLLLLSGFVGIACRNGIRGPTDLLLPLLLFIQLEALLVLTIILLSIFLQRIARPAAINNFFSILGYGSAFLALAPNVLVASQPREALTWVLLQSGNFSGWIGRLLSPPRWIIDQLLDGPGGAPFLRWQVFWLTAFALGVGMFLAMCRAHWLTFVHPGKAMRGVRSDAWLSGMFRKETLLLKSDFNLLSNSLFMPITIIAFEVLIFRQHLSFFGLPHAMNMMGAAAMYFCLFGPINAVGSEGKAIFFLETLPLSPDSLIGNKVFFWSLVAESFFLPASLGLGWYLGLDPWDLVALTVWLAVLIPFLVWVGVSMSAIYPKFDGKVLQQRSSLEGKVLGALAMGLAMPVKDFGAASLAAALNFFLLALSVHGKAAEALASRLDPERRRIPRFRAHDAFLAILVAMGIQGIVGALARAAVPVADSTLWPWFFAYLLGMGVLGFSTWSYSRERFPAPGEALGFRRCHPLDLLIAMGGAAALAGLGGWYLDWLERSGYDVFAPTLDIWNASVTLAGPTWSFGLLVLTTCIVAPLAEEAFFRGFADQAWRDLGWTGVGGVLASGVFFAIQHPPLSMPLTFLLGVFCTLLFRVSRSLLPGILLHSLYNAGIWYIYAGHL